jgi:hypothetical protein
MTTFQNRERGFEAQFAHEQELQFKATVRRNRALGIWAAEKLRLAGHAADAYSKTLATADLENPGTDSVFRTIRADFDANGVAQSDHQIRRTMDELMTKALADIKADRH